MATVATGEQGSDLYDFLKGLPANEGVTLDELAQHIDTSAGRVAQLLTRIRRGELRVAHQRKGEKYDALNIYFDRESQKYYNLSNQASGPVGPILQTWFMDIATRMRALNAALETQIDMASNAKTAAARNDLLSQLPDEQINTVLELAGELEQHRTVIEHLRRQRAS